MAKKVSKETSKKCRDAANRRWNKPGAKDRASKLMKELWERPEYRAKFEGKKHTEEHNRKIGVASKRNWENPTYRKKMADIDNSEEHKEKASLAMKAVWRDPVKRKRIINSLIGRVFGEVARANIGEAVRRRWKEDLEYREKMVNLMIERWTDPDWREYFSDIMFGHEVSDETKQKLSVAALEQWENPRFREFMSKQIIDQWSDLEYKKNHSGENSWNWKGGSKNNYGLNWNEMRSLARERDNYTCQLCLEKENGRNHSVHHIEPFRNFDDYKKANKLENLITFCQSCHIKVEFNIDLLLSIFSQTEEACCGIDKC